MCRDLGRYVITEKLMSNFWSFLFSFFLSFDSRSATFDCIPWLLPGKHCVFRIRPETVDSGMRDSLSKALVGSGMATWD